MGLSRAGRGAREVRSRIGHGNQFIPTFKKCQLFVTSIKSDTKKIPTLLIGIEKSFDLNHFGA
jgi:hypothetical protein